jgi:hypothetical protein
VHVDGSVSTETVLGPAPLEEDELMGIVRSARLVEKSPMVSKQRNAAEDAAMWANQRPLRNMAGSSLAQSELFE